VAGTAMRYSLTVDPDGGQGRPLTNPADRDRTSGVIPC